MSARTWIGGPGRKGETHADWPCDFVFTQKLEEDCAKKGEYDKAQEAKDDKLMYDEALVPCDSRTDALTVFTELKEHWKNELDAEEEPLDNSNWKVQIGEISICCIYADPNRNEEIEYELDDFEIVIYSPKIVYGVDSVMERPVFCLFTGRSVMPDGWAQMIARNRNPTFIKYCCMGEKEFKPAPVWQSPRGSRPNAEPNKQHATPEATP